MVFFLYIEPRTSEFEYVNLFKFLNVIRSKHSLYRLNFLCPYIGLSGCGAVSLKDLPCVFIAGDHRRKLEGSFTLLAKRLYTG